MFKQIVPSEVVKSSQKVKSLFCGGSKGLAMRTMWKIFMCRGVGKMKNPSCFTGAKIYFLDNLLKNNKQNLLKSILD
jgi:hypothetical protein